MDRTQQRRQVGDEAVSALGEPSLVPGRVEAPEVLAPPRGVRWPDEVRASLGRERCERELRVHASSCGERYASASAT